MTQTIRKLENHKNHVSVEIRRGVSATQSLYSYTLHAWKFTLDDLTGYIEGQEFEDDSAQHQELVEITKLFATSKFKYIWRTNSENGHDDYSGYFATKQEAIDDMMNQCC
jgi:uncharacterized Zn finger protein